jgi:hypothetical protein
MPRAAFVTAVVAVVALSLSSLSLAIAGKGNPIADAVQAVGLGGEVGPTQHEDGFEGCTPGFWKQDQHFDSWPSGYSPTDTVDSVFDLPTSLSSFADDTLVSALGGGGGPGITGAAEILLRAGVAAVLNAASVDYPLSEAAVISMVNTALASENRDTMLATAATLDNNNNLGCPLN